MTEGTSLSVAVDLFAYWNADAWSVKSTTELTEFGLVEPAQLWNRLLDMVAASGVQAIEVTFAPFDIETALRAFGSTDALRAALDARGLRIHSGYLGAMAQVDPEQAHTVQRLHADIERHSNLLAEVGAELIIGSAPARATRGARPARFAGLRETERLATVYNHAGAIAFGCGLSLALHTESHSMLWLERDIDLFMLACDPFYVGLCPDAGHIVLGGGDPVAVVDRHADRITLAHWKDAVGPISWDLPIDDHVYEAHQELCRVPGEGVVDWTAWAAAMRRTPGANLIMIELDADPTPIASIARGVASLHALLSTPA